MTIAPIDQRIAALSVYDLARVLELLPDSDPDALLSDIRLRAREIERLRQMNNGMAELIDERTEALRSAKHRVATDIYHLWNIGELADALEEAGL